MLSYDEFAALDGHAKFALPGFTDPASIRSHLAAEIADMVTGAVEPYPIAWGEKTPEVVVMTAGQYRALRGDDDPPDGVVDDPTVHHCSAAPLDDSRQVSVDELATLLGVRNGAGPVGGTRDARTAYVLLAGAGFLEDLAPLAGPTADDPASTACEPRSSGSSRILRPGEATVVIASGGSRVVETSGTAWSPICGPSPARRRTTG